jgi:WD40 repeat protein
MIRFLGVCVLLAVGCVTAVAILAQYLPGWGDSKGPTTRVKPELKDPVREDQDDHRGGGIPDRDSRATRSNSDDRPVTVRMQTGLPGGRDQPLIVHEARLVPTERQDVPSERDGKILCVATHLKKDEVVPRDKLIEFEFRVVATPVERGEIVKEEELVSVPGASKRYRLARETDEFKPGDTVVVPIKVKLRKLEQNDWVEAGDLVAVVNPALQIEDLLAKHTKVDAAEAERKATEAQKIEYERRVAYMKGPVGRAISKDEINATVASFEKAKFEEIAKMSQIKQAQRELAAAMTTLKMHQIRATISGKVKQFLRQPGEAVKTLEPVLHIQNPRLLRVEGQVELQDALVLRRRLEDARRYREEANRLRKTNEAKAQYWEQAADLLLRVEVEASRAEPPRAALRGHLQEVTCVAVSRGGPLVRIVSGSEDETVRIWERVPGGQSWQQKHRLDHYAVVRAVACSPPRSKVNRLLTGTATGRGRLFDLDRLEKSEKLLKNRHAGAILCATFNPDGSRCATGGEDRSVVIWDAETGEERIRITGAHKAAVTSVQFTPDGRRLVTAGRDKRLVVWALDGDKATLVDQFDRRSGEVAQLGVSPDGEQVLFDEGRELRILSLKNGGIEGTLKNAANAVNFSTMALYSPDGKIILTNGGAPGRLQLWRAPAPGVRPAELRRLIWTKGPATCGAFAPDGSFAVTGTADNQVLVWDLPIKAEAEAPLTAQLSYVEEFLDSSLGRVSVRADLKAPDWVLPGGTATMVIPPRRN